jgi:hypothetical protein
VKTKLSCLAAAAFVLGAGAFAAATVDVKSVKALTEEEYRQCMAPIEEAYSRAMGYCVEVVAPRSGVSSWEFEACVWNAQTPYDSGSEQCANAYL